MEGRDGLLGAASFLIGLAQPVEGQVVDFPLGVLFQDPLKRGDRFGGVPLEIGLVAFREEGCLVGLGVSGGDGTAEEDRAEEEL